MRLLFAVALFAISLILAACSLGPSLVVMKNPKTGEVIQCKGSGASEYTDMTMARECAAGYQASGWTRMN